MCVVVPVRCNVVFSPHTSIAAAVDHSLLVVQLCVFVIYDVLRSHALKGMFVPYKCFRLTQKTVSLFLLFCICKQCQPFPECVHALLLANAIVVINYRKPGGTSKHKFNTLYLIKKKRIMKNTEIT